MIDVTIERLLNLQGIHLQGTEEDPGILPLVSDYVNADVDTAASKYALGIEMTTYTLHITIAKEFLQELNSKGLWLYVGKFVDGAYTVVYQGV